MGQLADAIVGMVKGDTTLNALIDGRIYPATVPQEKALPAVTYQVISTLRTISKDGDTGIRSYRVQFNILGKNTQVLADIADGLLELFHIFYPTISNGVRILVAHAEDTEEDDYEPDVNVYVKRMDFRIKTSH